ncbi:MAG: HNH endonuclease [Steroidobacteraceae bacterium]
MTAALKPCIELLPNGRICGALSERGRCAEHRRAEQQRKGSSTARGYGAEHRRLAKEVVTEHVRRYGHVCPGYGIPPHTALKFQLHHVDGNVLNRARSNLTALCPACNKREENERNQGKPPGSKASVPDQPKKKQFLIA